jgi:hypothetical protein
MINNTNFLENWEGKITFMGYFKALFWNNRWEPEDNIRQTW